jgi:hypothetical protein
VRTFRTLAALFFVVALSLFGSAALGQQDQSQSGSGDPVADAARKAREQKKTAPKPKKVFTDEDIAPRPVADTPQPAASSANPDDAASAATTASSHASDNSSEKSEKKEDPNSEAAWRKRFAAQRRKISDTEMEIDVLQREAEKADVQYYSDPQKALREQFTRDDINAKNEKIAAKKKDLADLKQQLSDLEDELRRSGGDPSWAR